MTSAHEKCSCALRNLRFDWIQDPGVVLSERLKDVGLDFDYIKTYLELFEVYRKKLYRNLEAKYRPLIELVVPAHFSWQINTMWTMIKCRLTGDQTYEQVRKAILTPQPNDEYDELSVLKGPIYDSKSGRWSYVKQ